MPIGGFEECARREVVQLVIAAEDRPPRLHLGGGPTWAAAGWLQRHPPPQHPRQPLSPPPSGRGKRAAGQQDSRAGGQQGQQGQAQGQRRQQQLPQPYRWSGHSWWASRLAAHDALQPGCRGLRHRAAAPPSAYACLSRPFGQRQMLPLPVPSASRLWPSILCSVSACVRATLRRTGRISRRQVPPLENGTDGSVFSFVPACHHGVTSGARRPTVCFHFSAHFSDKCKSWRIRKDNRNKNRSDFRCIFGTVRYTFANYGGGGGKNTCVCALRADSDSVFLVLSD